MKPDTGLSSFLIPEQYQFKRGLIPRLPVLRLNYGELFCQESAVRIDSSNSHGIGLFKLRCGYRSNARILKIAIQKTSEISRRSLPGPGLLKNLAISRPGRLMLHHVRQRVSRQDSKNTMDAITDTEWKLHSLIMSPKLRSLPYYLAFCFC